MNDKEKQLKKIFKEIEKYDDGKHDYKIINLCDDGLKIDNKNPKLYFYKARSLYQLALYNKDSNKYLEAIKNFNIVFDIEPDNKVTHYNRGLCYFYLALNENINEEYLHKAIEDFDNIIIILHQFEKNIKTKNDIIVLNKKYDESYSIRALSYVYLNKYEEALNDFNMAIKYNSESGEYYYNRGLCYYKFAIKNNNDINYLKSAIKDFNKSIELNEKNYFVYYYIGICYYELKNYNESIKNYELSEKYCKYNYDKLSIQDKKIECLLKLNNKENEIYNLYKNIILNIYKEFDNETIIHTCDLFNISSSITENVLSLKNKIYVNENEIIDNNKNIINKAIQDDFYNKKYYYEIRNNSLYNYTRVNKDTLRSILNNTLWCSNTKNFNDPVDPYIRNVKKEEQNKFYDYLLEKIKIACLTTHNDNTLMWSHYADKHQGICIEYDINKILNENNDKILIKKISYNRKMISYDTFINKQKKSINSILIDDKTLNNITDIFTVKSKEWEYEDEYRILFYDEKNENSNGTLINLSIKSICFGVQTSKEDKELVYDIVNFINLKNENIDKYKKIELYEAHLDDNELFKINIKPYKHKK
ncbi:TPR domain-containing protein [Brachyspira intermedia PWS/A]|uniref:TPR domain-containing protein n=1 Tax=Brachyspira intermedia (strain ATCC 51140 / PWS/A) TaxID=1045858 RepID=G0EQF8_BRAIP|nr:DUF2971 domain-containing protein [Brachyspira intermedia]AEM20863.1 TPR domain-containing protein [Brachyspira intermedia PWS/A]